MDNKPIIVCAFPGMGKTYLAQNIEAPFVAADLDFGHFRSHVMNDERTWVEMANAPLSIRDLSCSPIMWPLLRARYKTVYSYYTAMFIELVRQVASMDVDVILVNSLEVIGCVPDAEYWVVVPSSISWWRSIMDCRKHQMKVDGCSMAKMNKHDRFVNTISPAVFTQWHTEGSDSTRVTRLYSVNDPLIWQRELLARLRQIRGC